MIAFALILILTVHMNPFHGRHETSLLRDSLTGIILLQWSNETIARSQMKQQQIISSRLTAEPFERKEKRITSQTCSVGNARLPVSGK